MKFSRREKKSSFKKREQKKKIEGGEGNKMNQYTHNEPKSIKNKN